MNAFALFVFAAFVLSLASAAPHSEFFIRSAKWSRLGASGGSLVSGRGNFRPGFFGRDWRSALAEPSFSKRSGSRTWLFVTDGY